MTTFLAPAAPATTSPAIQPWLRTQLPARTLAWPALAPKAPRQQPAAAQPVVSCAGLGMTEFVRRADLADDRVEQLVEQNQKDHANNQYGCEVLWHRKFGESFIDMVRDTPLHETVSMLDADCPWSNWGEPPVLDAVDYGYLADLLREELSEAATVGKARLRLERALWWVETRAHQLATQA